MATKRTSQKRKRGKRARKRLRILIAIGVVVGVLVLGFLIDSALYYNKVHGGVTISGQDFGGLTRDEAIMELRGLVEHAEESPITLISGQRSWPVLPDDVGTKIDVVGAVTEAMDVSRGSNFIVDQFRRLALYFRDIDVPLEGTVDEEKMDLLLAGIAKEIEVPPVNPGLAITGLTIKPVEGRKGRVVDQATLRVDLRALLLTLHTTELEIPMVIKEPTLQAEDNQQAVALAKTMISAPVTLKHGDSSWKLTPEQIGAYMDFTTEDRGGVVTLIPFLSAKKMEPFLEEIAGAVYRKPVNASFKGDGTQAWVVAAVEGRKLDPEKTAAALTAAALKEESRSSKVALTVTEPDRTTAEAEAMGIRDKLASFTTQWEGTKDRQTNVRITTQYASNVILAPGEVYNFDKQIGSRTEDRGYKLAKGITGPGKLEDVLGGGICQVSTTLFNTAFFAGLEILERKNHSIYIDHYPLGRDATVSAESPNLRFRNDTDHHILVRGASDGINTTFVIYGTKTGRKVSYTTSDFYDVKPMEKVEYNKSALGPGTTEIKTEGQEGRSIKVVRMVKSASGEVIHNDTFISIWKMIARETYIGTGSTTTTKAPTTTTQKATTTTAAPTTTTTAAPAEGTG